MKKKKLRLVIDISMIIVLPMLMAYSLIGEAFHEIIGTIMFGLFITHQIINRRWYSSLFKGRYTASRVFQIVLNLALLAFMLLQPVSGILMSKHLYTFLPTFPVSAYARQIHMAFAYWGYVLICMHAGLHMVSPIKRLYAKSKGLCMLIGVLTLGISIRGIFAFVNRGFVRYMTGKVAFAFFDYSEPRVFFFLDYVAVMILFMMIGFGCFSILAGKRRSIQ